MWEMRWEGGRDVGWWDGGGWMRGIITPLSPLKYTNRLQGVTSFNPVFLNRLLLENLFEYYC
jgi:hypothetical protein